jgi:hypothetical protein
MRGNEKRMTMTKVTINNYGPVTKAMKRTPVEMIAAAQELFDLGVFVIPIRPGEKSPVDKAWTKLRLTYKEFPKAFTDGRGLGALTGIEPAYIADFDIDDLLALEIVAKGLIPGQPKTTWIFGHESKPRSHFIYQFPGEYKGAVFEDDVDPEANVRRGELKKHMLLEIGGTGGQTVFPPSMHKSGEPITWDEKPTKNNLGEANVGTLHPWAAHVAVAALLARHYPLLGDGHKLAHALSGWLGLAGWCEEEVIAIIAAAAIAARDPDVSERERNVRSTFQRLTAGNEAVEQRRHLEELLGEPGKKICAKIAEWLNLSTTRTVSVRRDEERYVVENGSICAIEVSVKGRGENKETVRTIVPLANFSAMIVKQVKLDDGVTNVAAHVISGALDDGTPLPETRVLAADFDAMKWVSKDWAVHNAIPRPGFGVKDKLREGIQVLSVRGTKPPFEHIFTHTGWVKLETGWAFLHAAGAVGGNAAVDLSNAPSLERYRLPSAVDDRAHAMKSSLALLDVAPDSITVPLWAAMFRAPLASRLPLNFTIWLDAPTGNVKTTLASLFISHFGEFDVNHSPANWSSTANALEHQAFLLQDLPLLIDEYVPTSVRDVRELEAKAARLIRSQGNLTGRGRMDQNLRQRQSFPPRGLIVSTGEGRPPGESLAARCIVLEPRKSTVNLEKLTEAQKLAEHLPCAMSGYIAWLAPQLDNLHSKLLKMQHDGRTRMFRDFSHLRVPETVGSVRVGAELAVEYAVNCKAIDEKKAEELRKRIDEALTSTVVAHAGRVREENPARRFLRVLISALDSGQALMWHKDSDVFPPRDVIGWYDDECLYFLPEVAQKTVAEFCQKQGETFNTRERVVREQLKELGVLERSGDSLTFVVLLGSKVRRVLKLWRNKAEALVDGAVFPNEPPKILEKNDDTERKKMK